MSEENTDIASIKDDAKEIWETNKKLYEQYLIDMYKKVLDIEKQVKEVKDRMIKARPKKKQKLTELLKTSKEWADIVKSCQSIVSNASGVLTAPPNIDLSGVYKIKDKAYGIIITKLQIQLMTVKKLMLKLQMNMEEVSRKCLVASLKNKGADPVQIAIPLAELQVVAFTINVIQTTINLICQLFVSPIAVPAQGLTFFPTPKSIVATEMPIANPMVSNVYNIPPFIMQAIDIALFAVETANNVLRVANIVAGAAKYAAAVTAMSKTGSLDIDERAFCVALEKINANIIFKAVDYILNLQFAPMPLPRFEKLHLLNLGYLNWLITGYEPGAKKTFGIPGMP